MVDWKKRDQLVGNHARAIAQDVYDVVAMEYGEAFAEVSRQKALYAFRQGAYWAFDRVERETYAKREELA